MLQKIRNSKLSKGLSVLFALIIMDIFNPAAVFALTGGPSQPEIQSFEPIGTSDMVNLFTGDFNYNIPLIDVGGYPVNMSYNSGITMDQEASWVGLGWNLNTGAITRQLRGLPDDFNGDLVTKEFNLKPNETYTASGGPNIEAFGIGGLSLTLGISYNNYNGVGVSTSVNPTLSFGESGSANMTVGLGISSGPDGLALSPSTSFGKKMSINAGASYSARGGLTALSLGYSINTDKSNGKVKDGVAQKEGKGGIGGGSSISIGGATYTPSISMPMHSYSVSVNSKFAGGTFFGVNATWAVGGSYSKNELKSKSQIRRAYGYNNSHQAQNQQLALMDFNREKDLPYSRRVPALPVTNLTYDMYNVSGQGIAGSFRSFRSDVGYVYDAKTTGESASGSLGVEIGGGNLLHNGFDISVNDVNNSSGKWTSYNLAANKLKYRSTGLNNEVDYEPYYLKQLGEKNVESDPDFVANIHGDEAIRIDIASSGGFVSKTTGGYASQASLTNDLGAIIPAVRSERQRRALSISKLSKKEAIQVGLLDGEFYNSISHPEHHSSEYTVVKTDGSRYIYGIPLINKNQKEVSFNASGNIIDCSTGLVPYSGNDATTSNSRGQDNFYTSTTLPAYAHSFMLTAVLSHDYIDVTGNGPTEDDFGTYTLFEYDNTDAIDTYNWRTPYQENQAYYTEGYKSLKGGDGDDRGSFVYGQKEVKYLSRIKTKTHVAVFTSTSRKDAFEAAGIDGGIGAESFNKLDKIDLYAAPDYKENGGSATPIKSVHFEYDYSLCKGVPNNSDNYNGSNWDPHLDSDKGGKLTLKKVYFTYQNSHKGMLSPYEFEYESGNSNPDYDIKAYDRWGYYKPNNVSSCNDLNNSEFPYVDQDGAVHENAKAWCMKKIILPSGGEINVGYESDDYAYVQNRKAYQMFIVKGIDSYGTANQLPSTQFKVFFDAPKATNDAELYEKYLKDIFEKDDGYMYFNCLVDIKNSGDHEEYVRGYCRIINDDDEYEVSGGEAYITLQLIDGDNPISKAAWQFGRLNMPRIVYNQPATSNGVLNTIISLASAATGATMISQITEMFEGPDGYFRNRNYGTTVNLDKSFIRLMNPTGRKYGGGCRVKQITMNDSWHNMAAEESTITEDDYGQSYFYDLNGDGKGMSSGVASYEPQIGGDENSLKHPIFYGGPSKALAPDDEHYVETPFGESFYPSPSVGYSKVTVQNLARKDDSEPEPITIVKRHATGKIEHGFYTAKDFPTKARRTIKEAIPQKSNPIGQILSFDVKDYMTVSQGYVIELNDMHGKPKSQKVYAEGNSTPISTISYHYLRDGNELENEVTVINNNGTLDRAEVGVEYEMVADFREQESHAISAGAQVNFETFVVGIVPVFVPPVWPSFSSSKQRFRSAVNTKIVSRYGILEKTVATDLGSTVETKNLAYDTETGEVLVTETINDYNDPVYSFTYPAHWSYDRMGPSYKNIELSTEVSSGVITTPSSIDNVDGLLVPGDEILVNGSTRAWIWDDDDSDNDVFMIDRDGLIIAENGQTIKVIRSGRRNLQTTPMGSILSLKDPLKNESGGPYKNLAVEDAILYASNTIPWNLLHTPPDPLPSDNVYHPDDWEILQAGVTEFSEEWKGIVSNDSECDPYIAIGETVNPYVLGLRGNWRPKKSQLYLAEREQRDNVDNNLDIRHDGVFSTFSNFWTPPSTEGEKWGYDITDWTWTSEVTDYNQSGFEIENVDPLGRYSSAVYGYANTLPVLVANNSRRQDVLFDGFEDYAFKAVMSNTTYTCGEGKCLCTSDHFNFYEEITPSSDEAHTGNYSLLVTANNTTNNQVELSHTAPSSTANGVPFTFHEQDQLIPFSPITYSGDKKFLLSYWVKEDLSSVLDPEDYNDLTTYSDNSIDITVVSLLTPNNIRKSDIIDGWQKVEYEFTIPASSTADMNIALNADANHNVYFDDIRIQPLISSMKSYVYDEMSLRLMAELDENNYATFYEYDEEGALTRVKKETSKGIVTIQETRSSKYKP